MAPGTGKTVALFATCINDTMFPGTPIAVVKVLERLGCKVVFPKEQTCCGQMLTNTGYFKEAVPTVKSYVRAFEDYDSPSSALRVLHAARYGTSTRCWPNTSGDKSLKAASENW